MPIPPGTLVASYDFSDPLCYPGSGSTVFDLEGSLDLPISGATYAGTGQSKYFNFDGSSYIGAKNLNLLPSDNTFSINIWAKKDAIASGGIGFLLSIGANPGPSGTNPYITANEVTEKYSVQFSNGIGIVYSTSEIPNSVWSMITYTADGTNSKIYIDGVLDGTASQGIGSNPASNATLYLGAVTDGSNNPLVSNRFTGDIAIVEIYDTVLSANQIDTIYDDTATRFGITPAPPTLIGSYDFSDITCWPGSGNTVFDLTAENNDLVLSNPSGGAVTFGGTGQSKYASFNGDTTYLYRSQFSASGSTFGGPDFTLSVWHNYNNPQSNNAIFIMGGNGAAESGIQLQVNGSDADKVTAAFGIEITEGGQLVGIANTSNTWHMSTVTGDGSLLKLYQDGAFIGSTTEIGAWDGRAFIIGRGLSASYQPAPVGPGFRYAGLIGIAEVYSGALGSTDVSDLYDLQQPRFYPTPPPPNPLVVSYDFSDPACYPGTGNTIFDLSDTGLDLPISGATFVSDGQASYFSFDGSNDYIGKNGVTGLGVTFSVSMWSQYPSSATSLMFPFAAGTYVASDGAGPMFAINETTTNNAAFLFNDGIGTTNFTTTPNVWHNYTFTNDGTTTKAYKDGVLAASVAQGIGSWDTGGIYLGVPITTSGNYYPGFYFNGQIATFDVYNVALGSTSILDNYNSQAPRFDNLIVSYDFSDPLCYPGTGNTVFDLSGSGVNATITGATYAGTGQSKYFAFDGINDIIVSDSYNQSSKTVFTYNVWTQFTSTDLGYITITGLGVLGPSGGGSPVIAVNEIAPNGEYRFNFGYNFGEMVVPGTINTWQMLTVTADGTTAKFYLNGTQVDSAVQGTGAIDSGPQETRLGGYGVGLTPGPASGYYDGIIAIYEYYDTALSAGEITTIYDDTSPRFLPAPPPAPESIVGGRQFAQGFNG